MTDSERQELHTLMGQSGRDPEILYQHVRNWIEKREPPPIAELEMQQLIDAGLNAFGLQLFIESIANKRDAKYFKAISFQFRGIKVTFEPQPGIPIDTSHH